MNIDLAQDEIFGKNLGEEIAKVIFHLSKNKKIYLEISSMVNQSFVTHLKRMTKLVEDVKNNEISNAKASELELDYSFDFLREVLIYNNEDVSKEEIDKALFNTPLKLITLYIIMILNAHDMIMTKEINNDAKKKALLLLK